MGNDTDSIDWQKSITSILGTNSKSDDAPRTVKKLRKLVLLSLQMDESDKAAKKHFKKAIQTMEQDGTLQLDADGSITLLKKKSKDESDKKKRKRSKEEKKSKKKKKQKTEDYDDEKDTAVEGTCAVKENVANDEQDADETERSGIIPSKDKNKPCKGNPKGVTRLFLGNLPFAVDESSLSAFMPGEVEAIKWLTDKETGKFYGSAFIEMGNSQSAAEAVAMSGSKLIGRPVKISFAPAREGDTWPPAKKVVSGGTTGGQAGGQGIKALSAKPDNCVKLFIGNLSYDIDDEGITKFFGSVDAEVKAVRWLHHKDTGDFKGVGFVEFWNTEACEKAATLNGKNLLGRPIRIDWTD